ncbi:MAG: glycoside hydrolase domain-containing protein [Lentisphaerota bacterium]
MKLGKIALLLLAAVPLTAQETLNLKFDRPQEVKIGNSAVKIDGSFTPDKFLAYGESGISLPAESLAGSSGTIFFKFKVEKFKEPVLAPRYLITLRTKGRLTLGFHTFPNNPLLHFSFTDQTNKYYFKTSQPLKFDQVYQAAVTWDGTTIRVYLDGILQAEAKQPAAVEKISNLNIGPYKDGWIAPKPWGNDCFAGELRTWNTALPPEAIAAVSGVESKPLAQSYPALLVAPQLAGAPPQLDGELNDPAWQFAAGMVGVTDGRTPHKSWDLPPHSFKIMWDANNLYMGFDTLFPGRVAIKAGDTRTDKEPEVWGDESFEFYLLVNGKLYRFAGNVAGGFTEWLGTDSKWNGQWTYKTSLKMRIDDRQLWQGEAAIPWSTLGLSGPPETPVKFNFCRTWRLPETGTYSSLAESGQYNMTDLFPELYFAKTAPVMQIVEQNNPNMGKFEQKIKFASGRSASVRYQVQLAQANGSATPITLNDKIFTLQKDIPLTENFFMPIVNTGYDRLLFTYSQGEQVLMQEILPFQLNEEYVTAAPRFLHEQVGLTVKLSMLYGKFGKDFTGQLRLTGPDGREVYQSAVNSESEIPVKFIRANPAGLYKVELLNAKDGKSIFTREFNYPGIGAWEKLTFDNRIIPPFTALKTTQGANRLDVTMWGRNYQWNQQLFPNQIVTQGKELLSAPVALEINGKKVPAAELTTGITADHRAEFTATAQTADYRINEKSWIEYDGVQWNQVRIQAKANLKDVKLKIELPAELVKYLHTSDSFSWGTKLTETVNEGVRSFRFYPAVWLGTEDKGLCFFAESRVNWKSPGKDTYQIVKNKNTATLEVRLAGELKKGEEFAFDFGLLASPVRPFPKNYPLNTFSSHFSAPMNRPGKAPASNILIADANGELGGYFGDLPNLEKSPNGKFMRESIALIQKFGGRAIPYTCDRYLSNEYAEVAAFKDEWKISPDLTLDYMRDGQKYFLYDCCPTTGANAFYMYKFQEMLKRFKPDGIYFDFGIAPFCSNKEHGCDQRSPLLGQREFYRRIILCQLDAGIKEPVIVLHNTDSVQLPAITFATHLFNGEHIRQASSTMLHNGKDILDNYDLPMFASELNSLPFGLTNSIYMPTDKLMTQYGGGREPEDLYKFRMTKAVMAGGLIHNTIPALTRCHHGIYDKVVRIYDDFKVPEARFYGYWEHPALVKAGEDIYVSVYRHPTEPKALAVISHVGKAHQDQEIEIDFDSRLLGLKPLNHATDKMNAPDPDYAELDNRLKQYKVPYTRSPLKLGDFGSELRSIKNNQLKMKLNHHSFAIVELTE